ncbi:SprT-like domain-containing protein [Conchiformibius kuhniae]|uniref:SprT-like domain-containing protein n=1 Tax=Conchiformibius kuhniae TaxID=211502 RepID=A0A8T9MXS3_9NEIS|nr:SprT-like domain-containing protein [Conchiformibius kuhniae]UOP05258.1 SprT-like domain-containing protein [Conchiformibius kuhniae]
MNPPAAAPPTTQIHQALQFAYDFFNKNLFHGQLPPCLISLQRKAKTQGYFSFRRFIAEDGRYTDEIALNPEFFGVLPVLDTLSTLVHEMCHLWQQHFGKPGRRGYHNKEWADKMEAIGLMPSDTHKPGGKRTGEHMGDYIIENGLFMQVARNLLRTEFSIHWYDVYPPYPASFGQALTHTYYLNIDGELKRPPALAVERGMRPLYQTQPQPYHLVREETLAVLAANEPPADSAAPNEPPSRDPAAVRRLLSYQSGNTVVENRSNRLKYQCPCCLNAVWGKPKLNIICGDCSVHFEVSHNAGCA